MKKSFCILFIVILGCSLPSFSQQGTPRDGVYDRVNTAEKKPVPYVNVREADVFWKKRVWEVIDFREKMNQSFYYPEVPHNNWKSFMTVIMEALKDGSLTAYDATSSTDEFNLPLTYQEIISKYDKTDTIQKQSPNPPYATYDTVIVSKFNPADVKKIRIKEDWFFDKQRSVMDVRIIGICPIIDNFDEKGNFRGVEPMFWIYFPEARPIFAKTEVFNRFNGAAQLTYDDLFWKRIFSSYIYKVENVYDRKIIDYSQGLDALLEAEQVKKDIFDFEQDLWEY
jgi:gliding motility associated protien GldN